MNQRAGRAMSRLPSLALILPLPSPGAWAADASLWAQRLAADGGEVMREKHEIDGRGVEQEAEAAFSMFLRAADKVNEGA